jgi:hypothetical protein
MSLDPLFQFLYGGGLFGRPALEPTTNAGRYLRQLDRGDQSFKSAGEEIDLELQAALRRAQIVSKREVSA